MISELFLPAVVTMFVIVDPLGTAAVFAGLTARHDQRTRLRIAMQAVVLATVLTLLFGFFGKAFLAQLGVTIPAFRIAGGMLLFVTAFRMLMGTHDHAQVAHDNASDSQLHHLAVFPLAIPLLAGPGCMTAAILLYQQPLADASSVDIASVTAAILAVQGIALGCLLLAGRLQRVLGDSGSNLMARVFGLVLAAMSVQFVVDGLKAFGFA